MLANEIADGDDLPAGLVRYESVRRPRAALALKLSRRVDAAAQLASPIGWRVRNALARHTPQRIQRRQLAPLIRHQLP